jgi:hypothetical protein
VGATHLFPMEHPDETATRVLGMIDRLLAAGH